MKVLEIMQFVNIRNKKFSEMIKEETQKCLPSTDGKKYLFTFTPKLIDVDLNKDKPNWGYGWFVEGENDTLKLVKEDYDSSD